jgi:hypothetical protein
VYETEKISEAEYFYGQMSACEHDRMAFKFNLSAFLSASRSVLQFASDEAKTKSGGQAWYDSQVFCALTVKFFKDRRDFNIHVQPVGPIREVQVHIEESFHLDMVVSVTAMRDGKEQPSGGEPQRSVTTPEPSPSRVTVTETYRFAEWGGGENLMTLCGLYLDELRKIVVDGRSKGFLS